MVYLVFLWILNVIVLRGCIIADFFLRGKRVVGVNVRPSRGCCLVCGFVGGWLLGRRKSAKSVFQKSELAACCRSDSGLFKNNADSRRPRISSPSAEAEPDSIPFRGVPPHKKGDTPLQCLPSGIVYSFLIYISVKSFSLSGTSPLNSSRNKIITGSYPCILASCPIRK